MKLTVSKKILSGFSMLILIIIVLSLLSMYQISKVNNMLNNLYEKQLVGISYIKEVQINILSSQRAEKNLLLSKEPTEQAMHSESINTYNSLVEENIEKFKPTMVTDEARQQLDELEKIWQEIKKQQEKVIQLNQQGRHDDAFQASTQNRQNVDKMEKGIDAIAEIKDGLGKKDYDDSNILYNNIKKILTIVMILSVILSAFIGYYISSIISRPIVAMTKSAKEIANGDLTVENIKIKNNDEIGELANSFNQMADGLREIIKQVVDASQTAAAYSQELSASSEETSAATEQVARTINLLSDGVIKQSEEIDAASSNLNHISANIQQTAANSELVANASMKASDAAKIGVKEAENAINKIDRVKQVSDEIGNVVKNLESQSEEIGQIVDVIKNIADQTNLLALNAAIEAARAGEQGRGFAVVAEEVRKLAEESSASTQKIEELINNIQDSTHDAILVIEDGSNDIKEGVEAVNKAGNSFETIVKEIQGVVEQIQEISAATQEIASDSNEIVQSIDNIATISEDTASSSQQVSAAAEEQTASMEEVARSAQELAILAQELQTTVSKFKF